MKTPAVFVTALSLAVVASARPPRPVARFSAAPLAGAVPLAVQFTNLSGGSYSSMSMVFGDGASTASLWQRITHNYVTAGAFTATLTVTGKGGSSVYELPISATNAVVPTYRNVTIGWTGSPSCVYTAYQGTASGVYTRWIATTNVSCTFSNMLAGTMLYFTATATINHLTSPFSPELTFTP